MLKRITKMEKPMEKKNLTQFKPPVDGPVTVKCYGKDKTYATRQEAIKFFKEGIRCCEGSEQRRYVRIVMQLEDGAMHATDGE